MMIDGFELVGGIDGFIEWIFVVVEIFVGVNCWVIDMVDSEIFSFGLCIVDVIGVLV